MAGTNFNTRTTNTMSAFGMGSLHTDFYDRADSESVTDMPGQLRQKDLTFVMPDNASTYRPKRIRKYVGATHGGVILWYRPPHIPQHNPIEIVWCEIKRAIAWRYFGGFVQTNESIRLLVRNDEVATVRLSWYMSDATRTSRDKILPVPVPAAT